MIDSGPKVHHLAVELHVHLVEMLAPVANAFHPAHPLSPDIARKHRTEPVPPKPHGFVADINATLEQYILDVRRLSGKRTYIMTKTRITSGDELKYRNGLAVLRGRGISTPYPGSAVWLAVHLF